MIQKVLQKGTVQDLSEIKQNLEYWLSKTPEERVEAIELLWRERHGNAERLQRVARVVERK